MTDLINNGIPNFELEYLVRPGTNEIILSTAAAARLLEVSESTIRRNCEMLGIERKIEQMQTRSGVQGVAGIEESNFKLLLKRLRPEYIESLENVGLRVFVRGKLGLLDQQPTRSKMTRIEELELALKQAKLEDATTNLPGLAAINNALINTGINFLPGTTTAYEYQMNKTGGIFNRKQLNILNKRFGQAYRLASQGTKPKKRWVIVNGIPQKANEYPTDMMPIFDEIWESLRRGIH